MGLHRADGLVLDYGSCRHPYWVLDVAVRKILGDKPMINGLLQLARRRLVSAFLYSIEGFGAAWKSEEAIKVEVVLLPLLVGIAVYLGRTRLEQAIMISALLIVIIVELLNTAIEKTIDRISIEQNQLSKKVKDMGSAAVLGAILNAVMVWTLLLL